jgi:thioesterase domain-containing protein
VPVNTAGVGPTLYCIHGLSGDITAARPLSDAIGPHRPMKAFRAIGLQSGEVPFSSLVEIASAYVGDLIEDQPEGPYVIVGHCGGSLIAYEMAQQLLAQDREVAGLIMVDPAGRDNNPWLVDSGLKKQIRASNFSALARSRAAEAFKDPNLSGDQRRKLVEESLLGALGAYLPTPYPKSALLICTTGTGPQLLDPQRGFPRLIKNLDKAVFDTTHMALFSTEIKDVGAAINTYLDRVAPL